MCAEQRAVVACNGCIANVHVDLLMKSSIDNESAYDEKASINQN